MFVTPPPKPTPPQKKKLNPCPMGNEFHNFRKGHYEHIKYNAFSLTPTTVKVLNIW